MIRRRAVAVPVMAGLLLALGACGTRLRHPELASAREVVARATNHPYASRNVAAAVELERAQRALQRAEQSWAEDRDRDETRHLAYLAQRHGEIALANAARAQSDEALQQATAERERLRREADATRR